jgi:hypothetical protein
MFVVCTALCSGWQRWPVLAIPNGKDLAEDPRREDQRESEFDIGCDERERTNQHAAYWSSLNRKRHKQHGVVSANMLLHLEQDSTVSPTPHTRHVAILLRQAYYAM